MTGQRFSESRIVRVGRLALCAQSHLSLPPDAAHRGEGTNLQLSTEVNFAAARQWQFDICRFDAAAVNTPVLARQGIEGRPRSQEPICPMMSVVIWTTQFPGQSLTVPSRFRLISYCGGRHLVL
jgi:hypothetical protein